MIHRRREEAKTGIFKGNTILLNGCLGLEQRVTLSLCCSEVKTDKCITDGKDRKSVRKSTGAGGEAEEQTQSRLNKEVEDFPTFV